MEKKNTYLDLCFNTKAVERNMKETIEKKIVDDIFIIGNIQEHLYQKIDEIEPYIEIKDYADRNKFIKAASGFIVSYFSLSFLKSLFDRDIEALAELIMFLSSGLVGSLLFEIESRREFKQEYPEFYGIRDQFDIVAATNLKWRQRLLDDFSIYINKFYELPEVDVDQELLEILTRNNEYSLDKYDKTYIEMFDRYYNDFYRAEPVYEKKRKR